MRLAASQVADLLREPSSVSAVLLHGDDLGLIRARARELTRAVLGEKEDPFRLSVLTRDEHHRLAEEVRSASLSGGRRVVRVVDAGDGLAPSLARLTLDARDTLVIFEAGSLTGRSKLRALADKAEGWAAIACYPATPSMIAAEIKSKMAAAGCAISSGVAARLTSLLPVDTGTRISELEKLIIYSGSSGEISDQAVDCCVAGGVEASTPQLLDAVLGGVVDRVSPLLTTVIEDGATGPGLIAALSHHTQRVLKLRLLLDDGLSAEAACGMLMPPAFPRQAASLINQAALWSFDALLHLQDAIKVADLACKRAGSRDTTVAAHLMLMTAQRARRVN